MFSKMARDKPPGGPKRTKSGREFIAAQTELRQMEREVEQLSKTYQERKQYLAYLHRRKEELKTPKKDAREHLLKLEMFFKVEDTEADRQMAEKEMKEAKEMEAEVQKLKEECLEWKKRTQEMQLLAIKFSHYKEFLERVLPLTKFDNVDALAGHFEGLLHIRDQLYQKETQVQKKREQQMKDLQTLKKHHDEMRVQKNYKLSQLQTELENACCENQIWEKQWNQIQKRAAEKTLELGQIKLATLSLYEMANGTIGAEGLDINDTENQLEHIKNFILDNEDIVKQYRTYQQRDAKEQEQKQTQNI